MSEEMKSPVAPRGTQAPPQDAQQVPMAFIRNQPLLQLNTEAIGIIKQMLIAGKTKQEIILLGELIVDLGKKVE